MATAESDMTIDQGDRSEAGALTGGVAVVLRIEGAVELALAIAAFHTLVGNWWQFALLFFVPDLSMLGYLVNNRTGAVTYNAFHTYLAPAILSIVGFLLHWDHFYLYSAIWVAHIGFDRMLGYGLKYPQGFGATHLSWKIGKRASA